MEREELIDKYLHSELTPTEQEEFDQLLEQDHTFKEDVALLKDLKMASGAEDRAQLRKSMAGFEAKITAKETKVISLFNYKKLLVAASIVFVIAAGSIALLNPFGVDTEALYAKNFEPYKNVVTPIIRGENKDSEEITAFMSYEGKAYEAAANQFGELYKKTKKPYFLLYQGNALLAQNKTQEAIPILKQHIESKDELLERGKWYLALAYLKENRKKEAVALLEAIIQLGKFKKGAATQLLTKLQ